MFEDPKINRSAQTIQLHVGVVGLLGFGTHNSIFGTPLFRRIHTCTTQRWRHHRAVWLQPHLLPKIDSIKTQECGVVVMSALGCIFRRRSPPDQLYTHPRWCGHVSFQLPWSSSPPAATASYPASRIPALMFLTACFVTFVFCRMFFVSMPRVHKPNYAVNLAKISTSTWGGAYLPFPPRGGLIYRGGFFSCGSDGDVLPRGNTT